MQASDEVEELNNAFLKEVSSIQEQLELIREVHKKLERTNQQAKLATQPNEISKFREKAQQDITVRGAAARERVPGAVVLPCCVFKRPASPAQEVSKLAKTAKLRLDGLVQMDQELQAKPNMGPGTPSARMRESLTAALRRKLAGIMQEFSQMRTRLHDEYQEVVERRVFTVTGQKPSAEEVEGLIEVRGAGRRGWGGTCCFYKCLIWHGCCSFLACVYKTANRSLGSNHFLPLLCRRAKPRLSSRRRSWSRAARA